MTDEGAVLPVQVERGRAPDRAEGEFAGPNPVDTSLAATVGCGAFLLDPSPTQMIRDLGRPALALASQAELIGQMMRGKLQACTDKPTASGGRHTEQMGKHDENKATARDLDQT